MSPVAPPVATASSPHVEAWLDQRVPFDLGVHARPGTRERETPAAPPAQTEPGALAAPYRDDTPRSADGSEAFALGTECELEVWRVSDQQRTRVLRAQPRKAALATPAEPNDCWAVPLAAPPWVMGPFGLWNLESGAFWPLPRGVGHDLREDGHYAAFIDPVRGALVLLDLRAGQTRSVFDRRLRVGAGSSGSVFIGRGWLKGVAGFFTHFTAEVPSLRIVEVHMEGR